MASDGVEEVLAQIRASGGRVTSCKRAVVAVVADGGHEHLTADLIGERVIQQLPDTHVSTIYRILNELEDLGVVRHVHLGHGPSTYHLAADRHHHAVCEVCGAVVELPADLFDGATRRAFDDLGFVLDVTHFALGGRCSSCAG